MDPRSPSFEANLLYKTAQTPDIDLLVEEIRDTLEAHSTILLYAEKVDGVFTLLTCDTMQILLAFTDTGLPVEHFLESHRPTAAAIGETEMLAKLKEHKANVTVLVVDHETDGPVSTQWHETLKRTLCWEITDCISQHTEPDLVFWCDNDTLYSYDEFQRACTFSDRHAFAAPSNMAALHNYPQHFIDEPVLTESTLAWIDDQLDDSREVYEPQNDHGKQVSMETVMKVSLPAALAKQLDRIRSRGQAMRGLRTAAMVCVAAAICFGGLSAVPTVYY